MTEKLKEGGAVDDEWQVKQLDTLSYRLADGKDSQKPKI